MAQEPDPTLRDNPLRCYWQATRPGFLAASLVPALLGTAAVVQQGAQVSLILLGLTLLATALVHAGANVLNDYYDDANGTDRCNTQRIFPFTGGSRLIQNGVMRAEETFRFGLVLLAAVTVLGFGLAWVSGMGLLWIGGAGLLLGWGYSAPPLKLNSRGLGELAVALGFGSLIPLGAWFVQTGAFALYPVLISAPMALLLMNILYINQFPDHQADMATGKHHWVVRLGLDNAPWVYSMAVMLAAALIVLLMWLRYLPFWAWLSLLPLALALRAGLLLHRYARQPRMLEPAIKITIASAVGHGILLSLALVWGLKSLGPAY